jgi:hypothetical protein
MDMDSEQPQRNQINAVVNQLVIAQDQIEEYIAIANSLKTSMEPDVVVGQANEVFPRIWDSLSAARNGLAAMGCDVQQYVAIQAALAGKQGYGGLIDADEAKWDVKESLARLGLVKTQQVSFSLNVQGLALADEALGALKQTAPPQVHQELARQREQAAALGLDRKPRRINQKMVNLLLGAGLALLFVVLFLAMR